MILAIDWGAILGLCSTILTAILIPIFKKMYNNIKDQKTQQKQDSKTLSELPDKINDLKQENKKMKNMIKEIQDKQNEDKVDIEKFQIQTLKYMINDAFFGFNNIHEIPYETLIVAAEGCDIYTGKGYNHEIGARCQLIYEEIERRQQLRVDGANNE